MYLNCWNLIPKMYLKLGLLLCDRVVYFKILDIDIINISKLDVNRLNFLKIINYYLTITPAPPPKTKMLKYCE